MVLMSAVAAATNGAVRQAAPWIARLARLGYAAKALLYLTVGGLAASAALGVGGKVGADSQSAMRALLTVVERTVGRVLLGVVALGLFGYALWRLAEGLADPERHGHAPKGLVLRARSIGTGLIHLVLAYTAISLALGHYASGAGSDESERWTGRALAVPGGTPVLWGVAAGLVGYGLYQLHRAWRSKLGKRLVLPATSRRWVIVASRFGIASRGVVFGMMGVLIARAVHHRDASEAGGVGDSLRELLALGRWPFLVISLGLMAYGVHQILNARYRRIRVH